MIKLAFMTMNKKIIKFTINARKVVYFDDIWTKGIQIYPKDSNLIMQLRNSHKPNLQMMAALILDANKGKDLEEYQSAKTEEDLAAFIRKDCLGKGLLEVK